LIGYGETGAADSPSLPVTFKKEQGTVRRLRLLVLGAVVAIGVVGSAGVAAAHSKSVASQHTMGFEPDAASDVFTGQISSTMAACERARSVVLYRVVGDASVLDEAVATATSESSGLWSRGFGQARAGDYYAVAQKKVVRSRGHKHTCKPASTSVISVAPELEGLYLYPNPIKVSEASTGTVMLSVATEENLVVTLESSDTSVASVPASVTVPAGQSQATFQITGLRAGSVTIRATMGLESYTQPLEVE
jgi:hypothetical protein